MDTIKVSSAWLSNQVSEIVSSYDYNMNMRTLSYTCSNDTNLSLFDDKGMALKTQIQIGNGIEKYDQKVVFQAKKEGDYTVKFKIADAFSTYSTVETKIYAFTNWAPVAVINSCTLTGSTLSIDMSGSYDTDKKYGSTVKSYQVLIDGEVYMEFISPKINIILSQTQLININNSLYVAVRDNDGVLSPKIKAIIK